MPRHMHGHGTRARCVMLDSAVWQVLIGLALVFAVFSIALSRVNETVLGYLNARGRQLEAELRRLTGGAGHAADSPAPAIPSQSVQAQSPPPGAPVAVPLVGPAPRDLAAEL